MKIKLSKPVPWNSGSAELELPLEGLTGLDIIKAEDQRAAFKPGSTSQLLYGLAVAAVALKRPLDDLAALPAPDSNAIAFTALDFLGGGAAEVSGAPA